MVSSYPSTTFPKESPTRMSVVIEAVPKKLAELITNKLDIPTIGIGAGNGCDGQVLSSVGANCMGFTKMLTTVLLFSSTDFLIRLW